MKDAIELRDLDSFRNACTLHLSSLRNNKEVTMTHWDQFNHNIGYAGMYEDQPTSTDDSNGSETTQETSTSSDVAYTPTTGSTTTPCVAKKKKILKERKDAH